MSAKKSTYGNSAMRKNAPELRADEDMRYLADEPKGKAIPHFIVNDRPAASIIAKAVAVDPESIWTSKLLVDELHPGHPPADPRTPPHRDAV